jgi:uncharacterized protein involved in exopolysaccharide biosynthesis
LYLGAVFAHGDTMTSADGSETSNDEGGEPTGISPLEVLGFAVRAARRHIRICIGVGIGVAILGFGVSRVLPTTYDATARIFVDDSASKTEALSNPDRALPNLDPLSGTFELLTQKSSLVSMVEETGLIANWDATRSGVMRAKDHLMSWVSGGGSTLDDKREALAKMLANRMFLNRDKNIVTIRVMWTDPKITFELTKLAYKRLIALVQSRESASFSAAISILDDETKRASEAIEPALAELVRVRDQTKKPDVDNRVQPESNNVVQQNASVRVAPVTGVAAPKDDEDSPMRSTKQYAAKLADISAKVQAAEEPWRRRQADLKSHLIELRTVYGEEHPQVVQQQALIRAASEPPPELVELRKARTDLLKEIQSVPEDAPGNVASASVAIRHRSSNTPSRALRVRGARLTRADMEEDDDPATAAAKAALTSAIEHYNGLTNRLASARLQFTTTQATFATRFVVTGEPEFPRKPMKPLRTIVAIVSVFAGLLLGFLMGALRDLASGTIHESWQIRSFGLKELGDLKTFKPM